MQKITILITDDHTLVRQSWALLLNSDPRFHVVAQCATGEEAVEVAKKIHPDIVLMDINLTGMNGFETTSLIRNYSPSTKILAVSLHTLPAYAKKMMSSGANGYITKNSSQEEMVIAIMEIYQGRKYICREIKNAIVQLAIMDKEQPRGLNGISNRELDIISYLKKGLSSKQIANTLSLSTKTIEVHRYNILKKLGLPNVASLISYVNNCQLAMAE